MEDPTDYIKERRPGEDSSVFEVKGIRKAIQDAKLKSAATPYTYFVMTINMGPNEVKTDDRVCLIKAITKDFFSSVCFCQEVLGKFESRFVPEEYDFVKNGSHAAVIWSKEDFDGSNKGLETTNTSIIKVRNKVKVKHDTSELLSRIAMVKLTPRLKDEVKAGAEVGSVPGSVLAVSWHGPKKKLPERLDVFKGLIAFLMEVCEMTKIPSFIIGGDFNFDTLKDISDGDLMDGVTIPGYTLSDRQHQRAQSRGYIHYKDNFVFHSNNPKCLIDVIWTRPYDIAEDETTMGDLTSQDYAGVQTRLTKEKKLNELLDHDPILGLLQLGVLAKKSLTEGFKKLSITTNTA